MGLRKTKNQTDLNEIKKGLNNSWEKVLANVTKDVKFSPLSEAIGWFKYLMEENVPYGKQNRAIAMIHYYQKLKPNRTAEDDFKSYVLGWCIEILQAAALLCDDIMDESLTRRGKKCWYLRNDVGSNAMNDIIMLENSVYHIIRAHFRENPYYADILELFHGTNLLTCFGQHLDSKMSKHESCFENFTMEKYKTIVEYKTSYYSVYAPIALAMTLAGIKDESLYKSVEKIALELGYLFQVQDDFLDCYGDSELTGKIGTDIRDGKCTWLIVQALERGTIDQIAILKESYGTKKIEDELVVKRVFRELKLFQHFVNFEVNEYHKIRQEIADLPESIPKEPLESFLDQIYRRQK